MKTPRHERPAGRRFAVKARTASMRSLRATSAEPIDRRARGQGAATTTPATTSRRRIRRAARARRARAGGRPKHQEANTQSAEVRSRSASPATRTSLSLLAPTSAWRGVSVGSVGRLAETRGGGGSSARAPVHALADRATTSITLRMISGADASAISLATVRTFRRPSSSSSPVVTSTSMGHEDVRDGRRPGTARSAAAARTARSVALLERFTTRTSGAASCSSRRRRESSTFNERGELRAPHGVGYTSSGVEDSRRRSTRPSPRAQQHGATLC